MNNHFRCIMFSSRLNVVVWPYGVHVIPSCSAFNVNAVLLKTNGAPNKCRD